jgi:hypothetical protein
MLVNKTGIRLFNDYDLRVLLEKQVSTLQSEVKSELQSGLPQDRKTYLEKKISKYKIEPLSFDKDSITVSAADAMIPSEYFSSGFFVRPGERYSKQVLSFHLPFAGDADLLRCVSSTRILWTEEVIVSNNEIIFDLINFSNDHEAIIRERDRIIDYLIKQSGHVNNDVNAFNGKLPSAVEEVIKSEEENLNKKADFLAKLGTPLKENIKSISPHISPPIITSQNTVAKKATLKMFDVFICHASEDKDFVEKLATAIKKAGFEPWYDDFQLGWGDDLRPAIDEGLKHSRFGIVVFSKAFLKKKKWTEYELNGLFAREKQGKKVILPIWHNIDRQDLAEYSPAFADRMAKSSESISEIIKDLKILLGK